MFEKRVFKLPGETLPPDRFLDRFPESTFFPPIPPSFSDTKVSRTHPELNVFQRGGQIQKGFYLLFLAYVGFVGV